MKPTISSEHQWDENGDAQISDDSDSPFWSRSRACLWNENFIDKTPEKIRIDSRTLENPINSLEKTFNRVCSILNRNSGKGI